MVAKLLNYSQTLQADEADALAIALCHAHTRFSLNGYPSKVTPKRRRSSWRNFKPA